MRWLDGITNSKDRRLGKPWETVKYREVWRATAHGFAKSWTRLSDWTTTKGDKSFCTEKLSKDLQKSFAEVDFPGSSDSKAYFFVCLQIVCLQCGRPRFNPWVGKIFWRRKWQPTAVFLPGKSHGWRSLISYSPWGRKESDTTKWLHFHFAEVMVHGHKKEEVLDKLVEKK